MFENGTKVMIFSSGQTDLRSSQYQSGQWLDLVPVRKSDLKWTDQFAGGPVPEKKSV